MLPALGLAVVQIQPIIGAYPQTIFFIDEYFANVIVAKGAWVFRIMHMTFEPVELPVIKIETALCRDPKIPVFVFGDIVDIIIADTKRIGGVISVYRKIITIVNVDSILGGNPNKTHLVLMYIPNVTLRKTLLDGKVIKSYLL